MTFNVGDKVAIGNGAMDHGAEGTVTSVEFVQAHDTDMVYITYTKIPTEYPGDIRVGSDGGYLIHFVNLVKATERGILPGDRVQISKAGYEGCTGTVTYSKDDKGRHVVLITNDPRFDSLPDLKATGKCKAFKSDDLSRLIPVPENNLHEALDELLFNV